MDRHEWYAHGRGFAADDHAWQTPALTRRRTTVALGVGHMTGRAKSRIGTPPLKESVEESASEYGQYRLAEFHLTRIRSWRRHHRFF